MNTSPFQTAQYATENFVESVGAVTIKRSTREICLIRFELRKEWLLAKGRRNAGESRHHAALHEAREETGFVCDLLPLTMATRAPPAVEVGYTPDEPRVQREATEPFMLTCRQLDGGNSMKIIWWYIAAIDEDVEKEHGEAQFHARLVSFNEALNLPTYENDREVLCKAIEIVDTSQAASTTC